MTDENVDRDDRDLPDPDTYNVNTLYRGGRVFQREARINEEGLEYWVWVEVESPSANQHIQT